MTDLGQMNEGIGQSSGIPVESAPAAEPLVKTLPQDKIDGVYKKGYSTGYERAKSELMSQSQPASHVNPEYSPPPASSGNLHITQGGMSKLTAEQAEQADRIAREAAASVYETQKQQESGNAVIGRYVNKITEGQKKYTDFDTIAGPVLNEINSGNAEPGKAQLVLALADLENASDIIYELGRDPSKYGDLIRAGNTSQIEFRHKLNIIAQSVKQNIQATQQPAINEPISQVKRSPLSADNGQLSVRDLRNRPEFKG